MIDPVKLKDIVELAESVPDQYQQKCFELLLRNALTPNQVDESPPPRTNPTEVANGNGDEKGFLIPIDVKAFLEQYSLSQDIIGKQFVISGSEIRPKYSLGTTKKAVAQIHHALLLALEQSLTSGKFEFELEVLRTRCIDYKCYDSTNFSATMKKNKKLFKDLNKGQPVSLAPDGKAELADILASLGK